MRPIAVKTVKVIQKESGRDSRVRDIEKWRLHRRRTTKAIAETGFSAVWIILNYSLYWFHKISLYNIFDVYSF